jgi:hypothetical protein
MHADIETENGTRVIAGIDAMTWPALSRQVGESPPAGMANLAHFGAKRPT